MNLESVRREARRLAARERLVSPAFSYRLYPGAAAGACTIGAALEQRVGELFRSGKRLLALELDALGNERLFCLARRALAAIELEGRRRGQRAGDESYPGDAGMAHGEQARAIALAQAEAIGMRASAGGMLSPVKSMSFLVPLGPALEKTQGGPCPRCPARARCASRGR